MKTYKFCLLGVVAATVLTSAYAGDDIQQYALHWSDGGTAFADATLDLDVTAMSAALNNNTGGSFGRAPLSGFISDLTMTVSGAASGNGTFTDTDFDGFLFDTGGPVDFNSNLQPQANFGDFNLFSGTGAPNGVGPQTFVTGGSPGTEMSLTSFSPVPEPGTYALLGLGGVLCLMARRRLVAQ